MNRFLALTAVLALASSAFAGGAAAPSASQVLTGRVSTLTALLKEAGYKPELIRDGDSTLLHMYVGNSHVDLFLFGCKSDVCTRVNASAAFKLPENDDSVLSSVSGWGNDYFTQAYADDEGNAYLDSSYILKGGFTKANFQTWWSEYLSDLADFEKETGLSTED